MAARAGVPKRTVYDAVHGVGEAAHDRVASEPDAQPVPPTTSTGSDRDRERPPLPEPLPHPVVDNHCHLDIADGDWLETGDAIARAAEVGVRRIVQIGCDLPGAAWAVDAAPRSTPRWWPAWRCTPTRRRASPPRGGSTRRWPRSSASRRRTTRSVRSGRPGSTSSGPGRTGRDAQVESFVRHIDLAKRLDKTLVIHDRDAHDAVLDVIDAEGAPERWVMHCFSGNPRFARACLDRGAYLSLRRHRHLQERPAAARRAGGHAAGPGAGRDRRAVPDADALPRPPQRVVPRAGDGAGHGRGAR